MKVLLVLCLIATTAFASVETSDALVPNNPFSTRFPNAKCGTAFTAPKVKLIKTAGDSCDPADFEADETYACDVFSNLYCNSELKCVEIPDEGGDCEKTRTGSLNGCLDGLFCKPNDAGDKHVCTKEGDVGDACKSDDWCMQGLGCHFKKGTDTEGTCQEYGSQAAGTETTSYYFCEFGLGLKDGKCADTATGAKTALECDGMGEFCWNADDEKCYNLAADCQSTWENANYPSGKGKARHTVLTVTYSDRVAGACEELKCAFNMWTGLDDYTKYLNEFDCAPASALAPVAVLIAAVAALLF